MMSIFVKITILSTTVDNSYWQIVYKTKLKELVAPDSFSIFTTG
jgi:hypothetical protein